jgi:hypothetical protein
MKRNKIKTFLSDRENKREGVKTFSSSGILLPLLLSIDVQPWEMITVIAFAAAVVLISLLFIYLLLREKHAKVRQTAGTAQPEVVNDTAVGGDTESSNVVITLLPPADDDDEQIDEFEAEEEAEEEVEDNYIDDTGNPMMLPDYVQPTDEVVDVDDMDQSMIIRDATGEVVEVLKSVDQETGIALVVRYNKSFLAKYIQLSDDSKAYYIALKNEILGYKSTRSRVSWKYDNIHAGREPIAKFAVRGKTLCLFLALNPDDYKDTKYKIERTDAKKYEEVPLMYRIINQRRLKYAAELIAVLAEKYGLEHGDVVKDNYYQPYEATNSLIGKGLIREYFVRERYDDFLKKKSRAQKSKK